MSNLNQLLKRVKALEAANTGNLVTFVLANGSRATLSKMQFNRAFDDGLNGVVTTATQMLLKAVSCNEKGMTLELFKVLLPNGLQTVGWNKRDLLAATHPMLPRIVDEPEYQIQ